jgi:hypothetical protein
VIARVRALAVGIARAYVDQQREEFPAAKDPEPVRGKKQKPKEEMSAVGS